MISLDQVVLLQKKVEAAVAKINSLNGEVAQLSSENDALRRKCAELTNALADKSGLVSSLEAEQNRIEKGILEALDQLDAVEDAALATIAYDGAVGGGSESSQAESVQPQSAVESSEQSVPQAEKIERTQENTVNPYQGQSRMIDPLALSFGQHKNDGAEQNVDRQDDGVQPETGDVQSDGGNQFDIF